MRRLLVSVAFVAALLIAPSAALALDPPAASAPGATKAAPVISWTDVVGGVVYHILRADQACATAQPTDFNQIPGANVLIGVGSYTDNTATANQTYCYIVQADDGALTTANSASLPVIFDTTPPVVTAVISSGADGCGPGPFTVTGATATDNLTPPVTFTADTPPGSPLPYTPTGDVYGEPVFGIVGTDAAGNASLPFPVTGAHILDPTRPPAPVLEITTDPAQQKATLNWDSVIPDGAQVTGYHVHVKGPQGLSDPNLDPTATSLVFGNLQVDATYEYSLTAKDACGESAPSVRLVRLNDTSPPTAPIVAQPAFVAASKAVSLQWVPSSDNIQIDHYQILRNGVPLGVTDTSGYTDTDTARLQATSPSYVVRAVDTNGNTTNSDAKSTKVPDWTPPTQPVASARASGTTVTVTWNGAADNVGVVGYDVLRDDRPVASMTGAVRKYVDRNVPTGLHTWVVRARDDQGNGTDSTRQPLRIKKPRAVAKVVALKMAGALRGGAARYAINGPARLLLDVRIVGDLQKAKLRVYLQSGKGRITVWRGTPGSSAPRERLHSALAHHGWVTIKLNRTLHPGRTRLVLIASSRMVIVAKGVHKPSLRAG